MASGSVRARIPEGGDMKANPFKRLIYESRMLLAEHLLHWSLIVMPESEEKIRWACHVGEYCRWLMARLERKDWP